MVQDFQQGASVEILGKTHASTRAPRLTLPAFRLIGKSWVHCCATAVDAAKATSETSLMNIARVDEDVWWDGAMTQPNLDEAE